MNKKRKCFNLAHCVGRKLKRLLSGLRLYSPVSMGFGTSSLLLAKDNKLITTRSMKTLTKMHFLLMLLAVVGSSWERGFDETDDVDMLVTQWLSNP